MLVQVEFVGEIPTDAANESELDPLSMQVRRGTHWQELNGAERWEWVAMYQPLGNISR